MRSERRVFSAARVLCAGLGLCSAIACSDGGGVASQVNGNSAAADPPVDMGNPVPGGVFAGPAAGEGAAPAPQASGTGSPPPGAPEDPLPTDPSASGGEPQPSATETNFFGAGCLSDADCGENRRCEFPVEADAAPSPVADDAGRPDAGADAAVPPPFVPRGHCVAL
jgi:hypothetical protein